MKMGYGTASGSILQRLNQRIIKDNIDLNNFNQNNKIYRSQTSVHGELPLNEILIENSTYTNMNCLKKRLIKENLVKYECALCGNTGVWNNRKLVLQIDHINGKHNDHRLKNLRFLCPNCHSQTDTYSGKNNGIYHE